VVRVEPAVQEGPRGRLGRPDAGEGREEQDLSRRSRALTRPHRDEEVARPAAQAQPEDVAGVGLSTSAWKDPASATGRPSTLTTTSRSRRPAASAGLPGSTWTTTAPCASRECRGPGPRRG